MDYRTTKSPACNAPADSRWALVKARVRAWTDDRRDGLMVIGAWLVFALGLFVGVPAFQDWAPAIAAVFVAIIGAPAIAVALSVGALGAVGLDRLLTHITRRSERKP